MRRRRKTKVRSMLAVVFLPRRAVKGEGKEVKRAEASKEIKEVGKR